MDFNQVTHCLFSTSLQTGLLETQKNRRMGGKNHYTYIRDRARLFS
jgi:hypothetical protein